MFTVQLVIQLKEEFIAQKSCPVCTEETFLTNSIISGFCTLETLSPLIKGDTLTQKYFQV